MTVLEAVKHSKTTPVMYKNAIDAAQAALIAPETVLWAHTGNVTLDEALGGPEKGLKPGVSVVTSHRVLFAFCILGRSFTRQLLLPDILEAESKPGLAGSTLYIRSADGSLAVEGNLQTIPELKAALDSAISAAEKLDPAELENYRPSPAQAPQTTVPIPDLDPYFKKYYPSRVRAAAALHRDTGIELGQCRSLLDDYFKANLARVPMPKRVEVKKLRHIFDPKRAAVDKRIEELDKQGIACCPKCASTSITAGKRGFSVGKGLAGSLISPTAGLIAGAAGSNKIQCICLKCGHVWMP